MKQQKDEVIVIRKRKISKIREDDEDFLTKQHPDILAEALKHKFKFKIPKDERANNIGASISGTNSQNQSNQDEEDSVNKENETMDSDKIEELLKSPDKVKFSQVRINDKENSLYFVDKYIIYSYLNDPYKKICFKINNYVEVMSNHKIISGKFRGLVILKDTYKFTKNPLSEIELTFTKEEEYQSFLSLMKEI